MIQSDLVADLLKPNLHFITNLRKPTLVRTHDIMHNCRDFRLQRELKRIAPAHPQQFFKTATPQPHGFQHVAAIPHQIAEESDDIEKRRLAAGVRADQRAKRAERLVHRLQAAKRTSLNARKHNSMMMNNCSANYNSPRTVRWRRVSQSTRR